MIMDRSQITLQELNNILFYSTTTGTTVLENPWFNLLFKPGSKLIFIGATGINVTLTYKYLFT